MSSSTDGIIFTQVTEISRTYTFPKGEAVTIDNVIQINVSASGTHRLVSRNGDKKEYHIIPPTWIHIKFKSDKGFEM